MKNELLMHAGSGLRRGPAKRLLVAMALAALLPGCTGDDKGDATAEEIRAYIAHSNLDSSLPPWSTDRPGPANGKLKRWDFETALIPVKLNGSQLAIEAIDDIEAKLGLTLFDRTSIANLPDAQITRGLIVSIGTAAGPGDPRNNCGSVSSEPGVQNTSPPNFYNSAGVISTRLYINLGSSGCPNPGGRNTRHEFGHAMALGSHFPGFGDGPPINENFWNALYSVYHNPIGATESELVITLIQ